MTLVFEQLNKGWNAYPNGSESIVERVGDTLTFRFELNPFAYEGVSKGDEAVLTFSGCTRWRLGVTNDQGWFEGQCRYSDVAPRWGEFYEIVGDDPARNAPEDWRIIGADTNTGRHFLFYLRDETFECVADDWRIAPLK